MREFEYKLSRDAYSQEKLRYSEFDVDRELPPEISERLLGLGLNRLQYLGGMHNCRYVIVIDNLGSIELDEVSLPDGTHYYEAEIEDADLERHRRLTEWLRSAAPNARRSHVSKFERFRTAVSTSRLAKLAESVVDGSRAKSNCGAPS
jgi:hypothetical protein